MLVIQKLGSYRTRKNSVPYKDSESLLYSLLLRWSPPPVKMCTLVLNIELPHHAAPHVQVAAASVCSTAGDGGTIPSLCILFCFLTVMNISGSRNDFHAHSGFFPPFFPIDRFVAWGPGCCVIFYKVRVLEEKDTHTPQPCHSGQFIY